MDKKRSEGHHTSQRSQGERPNFPAACSSTHHVLRAPEHHQALVGTPSHHAQAWGSSRGLMVVAATKADCLWAEMPQRGPANPEKSVLTSEGEGQEGPQEDFLHLSVLVVV
jgi:hypothetical protein